MTSCAMQREIRCGCKSSPCVHTTHAHVCAVELLSKVFDLPVPFFLYATLCHFSHHFFIHWMLCLLSADGSTWLVASPDGTVDLLNVVSRQQTDC